MITKDILVQNGYKPFKWALKQYSSLGYQKRFSDDKGTKYFINFAEYAPYDGQPYYSYPCEIQIEFNGFTCNIELFFSADKTLSDYETQVEQIWQSLKADYYETN